MKKVSIYNANYNAIKSYILYKQGKQQEIFVDSYYTQQLVEYNEQMSIEHIQQHLDENGNKRIHTVFNNSINLIDMFNTIKEKLQNIEPIECRLVEKYVIELEETIKQDILK